MKDTNLAKLDYSVLQQCMHCGMCLPSCPTYSITKRERNSPRGRIAWMRAIADGEMEVDQAFADEMSYCVGCLACTSACPAGVDYGEMLETARAEVEAKGISDGWSRRFLRWLTMRQLFLKPRMLRATGRVLRLYQNSGAQGLFRKLKLSSLFGPELRGLELKTPHVRDRFSDELIAEWEDPLGAERYRVAMLTGCVQDLTFSDLNRDTVDVLRENGCKVFTPRLQHCCGSLHAHNGDLNTAVELAKAQIDAIDPFTFEAIISNAGGCGSHLKHYGHLLRAEPAYVERAEEWSRKLKDVSEWLVEIDFRRPKSGRNAEATREVLTYHDACHLCHGQKISAQPRSILNSLPRYELRECRDANTCCGSAGIYSITQPDTASLMLGRKLDNIEATGATTVAMGNPGCHLHMEAGLKAAGRDQVKVAHPVTLLAQAYREENRNGRVGAK